MTQQRAADRLLIRILPPLLFGCCVLYLLADQLTKAIPMLSNPTITFYLGHFRRGLVALPMLAFLAWGLVRLGLKPLDVPVMGEQRLGWFVPAVILAVAFGFLLLVANFAYRRLPQGDAVGVFFQTKVFALGRLYAPAPAYPEFFTVHSVRVFDNKWFAFYSPGHSILLLPGYLLGVTWLVGPVFGVLTLFLAYRVALENAGPGAAWLTLVLGATSPFLLFLGASHDAHVGTLFLGTAGLFFASRLARGGRSIYAAMLGLSIGGAFLCRPFTGFLLGIASVSYLVLTRPKSIPVMVIGVLPMIVLQLLYNKSLVGDYFTMPYQKLPLFHGIGFSSDFGHASFNIAGHTPLKALINLGYNLFTLSLQLLGWPGISLLPSGLVFFFRRDRFVLLLASSVLALLIGHSLYWFHGVTPYGPKYLAESIPSLLILSAMGLSELTRRLGGRDPTAAGDLMPQSLGAFVVLLLAYNLLCHIPFGFQHFRAGRWGETPRLMQAARELKLDNAIVFMKERMKHRSIFVTSGFVFNDPRLDNDIIFARDLGADNIRLIETYPDRQYFTVDENDYEITPYRHELR